MTGYNKLQCSAASPDSLLQVQPHIVKDSVWLGGESGGPALYVMASLVVELVPLRPKTVNAKVL